MYNGKTISFKRVLYRAMKHPNAEDLTEEQGAEYAFELIRNLQIAFTFDDTSEYKLIKNNRVEIPDDLIFIKGVRYHNIPKDYNFGDGQPVVDFADRVETYLSGLVNWLPVKYSGDIYHSSFHCEGYTNLESNVTDLTYTINNNYLYLSTQEGAVEISFRKLITDDDGYPMIPDDQSFENALYYYILKEHFFPLLGIGKISQYFYEKIEQNYDWYVAQTANNLKLGSLDHWETTMTGIRRLIQYQNFSDYGYKELHRRERIKKQ